jgi:hypothetical protein
VITPGQDLFMIVLYAPKLRGGEDYQRPLEAQGYEVVRAGSVQSLARHVQDGGVDLVILDDPSWEQTKGAVAALDSTLESVPRIWVSSWPEAPRQSGKLGVDALLIDPEDIPGLVARVSQLLSPRSAPGRATSASLFALGSSPSLSRFPSGTTPPPLAVEVDGTDEGALWEDATDAWTPPPKSH